MKNYKPGTEFVNEGMQCTVLHIAKLHHGNIALIDTSSCLEKFAVVRNLKNDEWDFATYFGHYADAKAYYNERV